MQAAVLVLLASVAVAADSQEERFLEGLRQRRLFTLAETYCLDRLSDSSLPDARRAELVVELSRAFTEHALHSTPTAAEPLWKQALEVTNEFGRRSPESPWLVLVRTQAAIVLLARGEQARQQSEVAPQNQQPLEDARGYLRLAVRQLEDTREEVAKQVLRTRGGGDDRQPTREQLLALDRNLAFQLARAYRNQGQAYAAGSPDRANSLSKAVELLTPLAQLTQADPLVWQARLEEVLCHRLLADAATATRRLDALLAQKEAPAEVMLRARAEQIRLALAMNRLDIALQTSRAGRTLDGQTSSDLELAALEAFTAAWRFAEQDKQAAEARQWQEQATQLIGEIHQRHGPYWSRRGEALLAGQVTTSTAPPSNLDLLVRAAESHYRSGQMDAALAAYERAQSFAMEQKQPQRAFELGYAAATIEHERKAHRAAADRYRKLALAMRQQPKAGEAHLLAVYNAAEEAKRHEPVTLDEYAALLDEHLQIWPTGSTADQARWLVGRLKEHQGDWPAAIAAYGRISPEHPQFAAAVEAVARGYAQQIERARSAGQPTQQLVTQAARYFEGLFLDDANRLPERWSPVQRSAASSAARIWLLATPPDYDRAERIVRAALGDAGDAEASWKSAMTGLLIAAAAGQGRVAAARQLMSDIATAGPPELLALLDSLSQLTSAAPPASRRELAALASEVARFLSPRRSELPPAGQAQFDRLEAQSLADAGQSAEALRRFAQLARAYPRDGQVQEQYALLLVEAGDKPSLETALAKWREVEQRSQPATPRWFRAKYYLALAHEKLGNKEHAAKIITLTQVLHPDLGGPELKARFQDLLARCK
jgi:hypothetical protein